MPTIAELQENLLLFLFADQLHNTSTCRETIKETYGINFEVVYSPLLESGKIEETGTDDPQDPSRNVVSLTEKGIEAVSAIISVAVS